MQATHLILDFQDDKFSISEVEKPSLNIESFFNFHKRIKNLFLDDLVRLGMFDMQKLQDLALRGYITLEAKEEIIKRLKND